MLVWIESAANDSKHRSIVLSVSKDSSNDEYFDIIVEESSEPVEIDCNDRCNISSVNCTSDDIAIGSYSDSPNSPNTEISRATYPCIGEANSGKYLSSTGFSNLEITGESELSFGDEPLLNMMIDGTLNPPGHSVLKKPNCSEVSIITFV